MDWYALPGLSEDAAAELDMLSATFPELGFEEASCTATLSVPAREGTSGAARAVAADLRLAVPSTYPATPLLVTVGRGRGGVDSAALQTQLRGMAVAAAEEEELCMYQLVEAARDAMGEAVETAHTCEICLEAVPPQEAFVAPACLHVFHRPCFRRWVTMYDARARSSTAAKAAAEHAHSVLHAAQEEAKAAVAAASSAAAASAALGEQLACLQSLLPPLRAGAVAGAAALRGLALPPAGAAAGTASLPAAAVVDALAPALRAAAPAPTAPKRRGAPEAAPLSPHEALLAAAQAVAADASGSTGTTLARAAKPALEALKTRAGVAAAAAAKAAGRAVAAEEAAAAVAAAQAGASGRVKDTPCALCRTQVPWAAVQSWFEAGAAAGSAAADGDTPTSPTPLDDATAAYVARVQQVVAAGLQRQLRQGGVLAEAVPAATAALAALGGVAGTPAPLKGPQGGGAAAAQRGRRRRRK